MFWPLCHVSVLIEAELNPTSRSLYAWFVYTYNGDRYVHSNTITLAMPALPICDEKEPHVIPNGTNVPLQRQLKSRHITMIRSVAASISAYYCRANVFLQRRRCVHFFGLEDSPLRDIL